MTRTGVVLAAGRGSRLAPVTHHTPKPLVPFFGVPLIHAAVCQLANAGVERVAINAHYLADIVVNYVCGPLRERFPSIEFHPSVEPTLLGTGGALVYLADWLREDREARRV